MPGVAGKDKKQRRLEGFTPIQVGATRKAAQTSPPLATFPAEQDVEGSDNSTPTLPEVVPCDLAAIMSEIKDFRREVNQQMGTLATRMDVLQTRTDAIAERTTGAEERIVEIETAMAPMKSTQNAHTSDLHALFEKLDDLEGRSRRANLRLVGAPEAETKGQKMELLLENLLPKWLPQAKLSPQFVVERAHRTPAQPPKPGMAPRAIIMKLLNYRDRDELLTAARLQGSMEWKGAKLSLYPDLTPAVQKARRKFDATRVLLRKHNIQYAMLHPAKLRVCHANRTHFFVDPQEAHAFAEGLGEPLEEPPELELTDI